VVDIEHDLVDFSLTQNMDIHFSYNASRPKSTAAQERRPLKVFALAFPADARRRFAGRALVVRVKPFAGSRPPGLPVSCRDLSVQIGPSGLSF
jgi:hypothetical protein